MISRTRRRFVRWAMCLTAIAHASIAFGSEFSLSPDSDEESIAKRVTAGDSIILENGVWRDVDLKFERLAGTAEHPILIRPRVAGRVVFTGATEFRISGQHVIVSGFVFRDTDGVSDVVQFRTHSQRLAHHGRMTNCRFEQTATSAAGTESRWLSVYGTHNRIDHCFFGGKRSRGPTLVVWVADIAENNLIDHNHFGHRPELGRNGGETIRIGTSQTSELTCRTTISDNYFHKCDGEAEIISSKSCENVFRHNVFDQCLGTLTLRHGHRCLVDGNVFLGKKKRGTGGVRIIGESHSVVNNYFEGLRGDAERSAVCMMNGIPNGSLNSYAPVKNAVVAHNSFVDCKVSIEIGVGAGRKQSAAPKKCRVVNNLFSSHKWPPLRFQAKPIDFEWRGNKRHGPRANDQMFDFEFIDLQHERALDGLFRPTHTDQLLTHVPSDLDHDLDGNPREELTVAGCDHPGMPFYVWPSASNTGPTWSNSTNAPK